VASEIGLTVPCLNQFKSIMARAVETTFSIEEALRIIDIYEPPARPRVDVKPRAATGQAITEAPRGILFHRYILDDRGLILAAKIVPPTSQNQKRMEDDLWGFVPGLLDKPIEEITWKCEQAIRNYDPCISCATHFLKVNIERE
jgi:coenzyme F420-reducing hydrogenase alpha subunit